MSREYLRISPRWSYIGYNILTWASKNKTFLKAVVTAFSTFLVAGVSGQLSWGLAWQGCVLSLITAVTKWAIDAVDYGVTEVRLNS